VEGKEVGGGVTLPVDTADQAVCPVGQKDSLKPYHEPSRRSVEQLENLKWSYRVCFGLSWLNKARL